MIHKSIMYWILEDFVVFITATSLVIYKSRVHSSWATLVKVENNHSDVVKSRSALSVSVKGDINFR